MKQDTLYIFNLFNVVHHDAQARDRAKSKHIPFEPESMCFQSLLHFFGCYYVIIFIDAAVLDARIQSFFELAFMRMRSICYASRSSPSQCFISLACASLFQGQRSV